MNIGTVAIGLNLLGLCDSTVKMLSLLCPRG